MALSSGPNAVIVRRGSLPRFPFFLGVALIAAALGDALVESVANSGALGGHFADNDHASIVPALLLGTALLVSFIAVRDGRSIAGTPHAGDWLATLARRCAARISGRDAVLAFSLQLAAVYAMENAEQLLLAGHGTTGLDWLGGPPPFAVLAHVLVGVGVLIAMQRFMRALVETLAKVVAFAVEAALLARARCGASVVRIRRQPPVLGRAQESRVRQVGERAPPLHLAPS